MTGEFPHVELIRRAAEAIRRRAQAADTDDARRPYGRRDADPVPSTQWGPLVDNYLGGEIGQHCMFWTPAAATAVADWLDIGANPYACVDLAPMIAVARAYLGEPAPEPEKETAPDNA